ncbi:MAG TPA: ATP-dependent DNA helicase [Polyangiaceae bacterium]
MARAVEKALADDDVLICEAGTGTGKTFAYLLPAIASGRKVIVSTATRALQEQIVRVDLPLIERILGQKTNVAVMKGLSNYVCRRRLAEQLSHQAGKKKDKRSLSVVADWAQTTNSGDISELAELEEGDPVWGDVTASADTRRGSQCSFYERCFVTRMRRQAEEARLVIVNHHLFFADLAMRGPHPGRVIPDYEAVIFDEAHQLEDIATDFFGTKTSSAKTERLTADIEQSLSMLSTYDPTLGADTVRNLVEQLRRVSKGYFDSFTKIASRGEGRREIDPDELKGEPYEAWLRLDSALEAMGALVATELGRMSQLRAGNANRELGSIQEGLEVATRRLDEQRSALAGIAEDKHQRVIWMEHGERNTSVTSAPVDLSNLLRTRIFDAVPCVVLTSATLTTSSSSLVASNVPSFGYLRQRLGIVELDRPVVELNVLSTFDYETRALLYTPKDLPAPSQPDFISAASTRISELIALTRGGAFVLTTSLRSMQRFYEELKPRHPELVVMIQGEAPKSELLRRFRSQENAVLVATASFWEGVDVPGRALRLVVLEKIPFYVPTDPLVRARSVALEAEGKNPFMDYMVPAAAITLKQGFGRLIRNRLDAGIVALLDERIHRRGYGQRLLRSLPPARRTDSLDSVRRFWALIEQGRATPSTESPVASLHQ